MIRSDIGLPHANAAPVPGELRAWLLAHRRAWDGWSTWAPAPEDARMRLTRLRAAGMDGGWSAPVIDQAIASIRAQERREYARRPKDGAW